MDICKKYKKTGEGKTNTALQDALFHEARCEGNNSGVMYRSDIVDEKHFAMRGYQCDLHPKTEFIAMLYGERVGKRGIIIQRGQKMQIAADGKKTILSSLKPEPIDISKWQTYEIIAKGNHLIHKVNGEVAIDLVDNDKLKLLKGKIGLQLHGGPPMKVEYRNIRLKRF